MTKETATHDEYPRRQFSEGDKACSNRQILSLRDGQWEPTGRRCSDSRPIPLSESERFQDKGKAPTGITTHPKYPGVAYHDGSTICLDGKIFIAQSGTFVMTDKTCHGQRSTGKGGGAQSTMEGSAASCPLPSDPSRKVPDGTIINYGGHLQICDDGYWIDYDG